MGNVSRKINSTLLGQNRSDLNRTQCYAPTGFDGWWLTISLNYFCMLLGLNLGFLIHKQWRT
ncbi:hypothetical protein HanXRQr2_Chr09g0382671 [Helianthus annuus]|uniref:Uncharacterized protein n=1 Tax=Helianthus annuus TaxID=4232 RepID=A0A9K3I6B2_HELAN|nr:hypothetical protein HanXRQr2_Chr09g0382671 [Helianthus annuus]KAJ0892675.1 hypothetical protein HanPSC8_Chr09g0368701 [Helianthus annuus]